MKQLKKGELILLIIAILLIGYSLISCLLWAVLPGFNTNHFLPLLAGGLGFFLAIGLLAVIRNKNYSGN